MELENIEYWRSLTNIGLTKIFVLKILSEGANHGYGILKWLESLTHGCCTPMFGTIYPILKNLTLGGYAKVKKDKPLKGGQKRRTYTLTSMGMKPFQIALDAWKTTIPYINRAIESEGPRIRKKGVKKDA